jgi:hypothetical protein
VINMVSKQMCRVRISIKYFMYWVSLISSGSVSMLEVDHSIKSIRYVY